MVTIDVLIVDDSPTARYALRRALESDPALRVVGEAADRHAAIDLVARLRPQLVTMDVFLRHEDGIEVTAALMSRSPVPILIVTGRNPEDPQLAYQAIEAGALDVFGKLPSSSNPSYENQRRRLVRLVKTLARVPVITRRRFGNRHDAAPPLAAPARPLDGTRIFEVILLGASTGGPPVLGQILRQVAAPSPLPIVVVQHMAAGFGEGFAGWLASTTGHRVLIVEKPEPVAPGTLYLAPVGRHLVFQTRRLLAPDDHAPRSYQRPSVDVLFESAAEHVGSSALAALLTGMGRDGADGLLALRQAGAYTLAQEPSTCTVASMPAAGIAANAVDAVVTPEELAARIAAILASRRATTGAASS